MASSITVSNQLPNNVTDRSRDTRRRKRKSKTLTHSQTRPNNQPQQPQHARWKSSAQQQIYSSKLLQALSEVRLGGSSNGSSSAPPRGRAVREAADRALAFAAKGKTRWSRAILTNRLKLKFRKQKRPRSAMASSSGTSRGGGRKPKVSVLRLRGKSLPAVQTKVRVLGRLVPGCRKETLPVILEEATDYIPALEMQVRALRDLVQRLSAVGTSSSSESGHEAEPNSN